MICGDYWEGVVLHSHPDLYAKQTGSLFKDQCFRYTGHHASHQGYLWKEIQYGSEVRIAIILKFRILRNNFESNLVTTRIF